MPGHVKLGKAGEPDPDPCPYLVVTLEMKREFALKPYDPKKSYWCPDGKGGYMESMLEDDNGTKAVVMCGHEVSNLKTCSYQILQERAYSYFFFQITEKDFQV